MGPALLSSASSVNGVRPIALANGVASTTGSPMPVTGQSVVTETGFDGDNGATWNPTIDVAVPATAVVGVYDGTVTHSVS